MDAAGVRDTQGLSEREAHDSDGKDAPEQEQMPYTAGDPDRMFLLHTFSMGSTWM